MRSSWHSANDAGWIAGDDRARRDIAADHAARADYRPLANANPF